jgi:hypothetical protein
MGAETLKTFSRNCIRGMWTGIKRFERGRFRHLFSFLPHGGRSNAEGEYPVDLDTIRSYNTNFRKNMKISVGERAKKDHEGEPGASGISTCDWRWRGGHISFGNPESLDVELIHRSSGNDLLKGEEGGPFRFKNY